RPRRFTPEDLFKHMRPAGVVRVNLIQMSYYTPRNPTSEKGNGFDNRYMLDMMALHPEAFVGTAIVDPRSEAPERQRDRLAGKGVRPFRILPALTKSPPARWLEPEGYGRMFAAGAKNNQALSCLIDPDALPDLDRMCRRHPNTPVIIDHLCRIGADGTV